MRAATHHSAVHLTTLTLSPHHPPHYRPNHEAGRVCRRDRSETSPRYTHDSPAPAMPVGRSVMPRFGPIHPHFVRTSPGLVKAL